MTEYKSEVKHIAFPVETVYGRLSDLNNLVAIQQNIDNPDLQERIRAQAAGNNVKPEQIERFIQKIKSLEITQDSVSGSAGMMGDLTLRIVDRDPQKTVKFAVEGIPVLATLYLQFLPEGESGTALRVVVKADLNFFIKQMVGSKLEKGVEAIAELLSKLPYA